MGPITIEEILVLALTFVGFLLTYFVIQRFFSKRDLQTRMASIQKTTSSHSKGAEAMRTEQLKILGNSRSRKNTSSFSQMFSGMTSGAKTKFERAGLTPINAPAIMAFSIVASLVFFITLGFILVVFVPPLNEQTMIIKLCVMLLAILLGYKFVDIAINFMIKRRYEKIRKDLSSALDLLVVCTNAGLSIDKSFEHVAQEIGDSNVELGKEFALTAIELAILPDRRVAFQNLAKRVYIPLIRGMATTLVQAEEQGSSISQTLKILSHEFSEKVLLEAEAKAAKLPAVLSVPVVALILPSLLIVLLAPAILSLNETYRFF
ncbi:MAG: type II secretion system F family protein [Pseudomonadota bacterium]